MNTTEVTLDRNLIPTLPPQHEECHPAVFAAAWAQRAAQYTPRRARPNRTPNGWLEVPSWVPVPRRPARLIAARSGAYVRMD